MYLRPSEIYFSQAEINSRFDQQSIHSGKNIGETLDDLVERRCTINDIPTISVMLRNGKWTTADNRRLWVFRHLEKLGKCTIIPVKEVFHIKPKKLKSKNGGKTVTFYPKRHATGRWHNQVCSIDPSSPLSIPSNANARNESSSTFGNSNLSMPKTLENYDQLNQQQVYADLNAVLGNLSLSTTRTIERFDPLKVRYTKETITVSSYFENLIFNIKWNINTENVDPITVYKVYGEHWATDGNKRLWAHKKAKLSNEKVSIQVNVKEDKDEFLVLMRKDRPWLSLIDILQSGENIQLIS